MFATNNTSYDPNKWWFYSECKQVSFWYGTFGLLSARNQIPFASKRMRKIICMWSLNLWERYLFFLASLIWIRVDVRLVNELLSTNIPIDLDASRNESIFCLNFKWQFLCVVVCVCDAIHHINWSSSHWNIYCFGWLIQLICCSDVFVSSKQTKKKWWAKQKYSALIKLDPSKCMHECWKKERTIQFGKQKWTKRKMMLFILIKLIAIC